MDDEKRPFRPTHSLLLKTTAVVLLLASVFVTVVSGIGIALSAVYGLYDGATDEEMKNELTEDYLNAVMNNVLMDYLNNPDTFSVTFSGYLSGVRYQILDADGRVLAGNYDDGRYDVHSEDVLPWDAYLHSYGSSVGEEATVPGIAAEQDEAVNSLPKESLRGDTESARPEHTVFTVRLWANNDVLRGARLTLYRILHVLNGMKTAVIVLCAVCLLLSAALVVFLLCAAGRRHNNDEPAEGVLDKIPTDLFALAVGAVEAVIVVVFMNYVVPDLNDVFSLAVFVTVLLYIPFMLLAVGFFMSIATRVKVGRLLSNTVIWRVIYALFRLFRWIFRGVRQIVRSIPMVWRTAVCAAVVLVANAFLVIASGSMEFVIMLTIGETLFFGILAVVYAASLRRVKDGISTIAGGDLNARVDTHGLPPLCRSAADDLNRVGDGLSHAVEERMRSERFKTELITNVSHDIKTPLTSIINYVDLIKKLEPTDETLCGYVDVLDRQSTRLRKLTEDLVEASKAQSGVLPVCLAPCGLSVLLEQVEGEYTEKLAAKNLRLVVTKPREELTISADGRHLGRIFDNLMNNILKYAQPGTRVYLDAKPEIRPDGTSGAVISFRNTSGAELNIPAEELMERFVRGDASRHTEGSGLGLSIVRSLTELQGGTMSLHIDGDLFKVRLEFPVIS